MDISSSPLQLNVLNTAQELLQLRELFKLVFESTPKVDNVNLDAISSSPSIYALGAFLDTTLVGGLIAYELPLLNGTKEMYLYDIAVLPTYHRQGVGTGLINALKTEAASRGVTTIFVEAEDDDEEAVAFYRSLGGEEIGVRHFNIHVV
jgi:aminoglycoside 3-N-acetyltransferase I